jgi:hypothetical protein
MNFGDSSLAPKRVYRLPDADADALKKSLADRTSAFSAALKGMRDAGLVITQDYVDGLAKDFSVRAPVITLAPVVAPGVVAAPPAPAPPVAASLRLVPPPAPEEPSALVKSQHAAKMSADLLADIREAKALGLTFSQAQIDEKAARYGVPAPRMETK